MQHHFAKKKEVFQMSKKDNDKQNKPDNYLRGIYSSKRRALIMQPPETLTIGQRLRRERYLRRWSQEQMAVFLDISTSYYGALERGERSLVLGSKGGSTILCICPMTTCTWASPFRVKRFQSMFTNLSGTAHVTTSTSCLVSARRTRWKTVTS